MKTAFLIPALALALHAQAPATTLRCDQNGWRVNGLDTYCTIVEIPAPFAGALSINSVNGSVTVRGWDGADVLVRAQIQTAATSQSAAQALAGLVSVDVSAAHVQASGPKTNIEQTWSASLEIFVPHTADLNVTTANGALSIADVQGHLQFKVANGAISLARLAGQVEGKVANGAVAIALGGDHWDGAGLNVTTACGAISVDAPYDYSAHFDAATTVGTIGTNYPVPAQNNTGRFWGKLSLGGSLVFDAGSGGAPIHVAATVGAIQIRRLPAE